MKNLSRLAPLLCSLALSSQASETHPFGFAPPEIYLSDFGARGLRIADLNQDGLQDLLTLNNDRGRIDIYLQRGDHDQAVKGKQALQPDRWQPVLEDARFTRSSVITGNSMYDCAVGDFNDDGQPDLFVTDSQNRGLVYHGPIRSGWTVSARIALNELQANPMGLAWDSSRNCLMVLANNSIQEITWNAESASYQAKTILPLHKPGKARGIQLIDINEDGQKDLVYEINGEANFNLAIHLREGDSFGSVQLPFLDPAGRHFRPYPGTPFALMSVHSRSRVVQKHSFDATHSNLELDSVDIKILPFQKEGGRNYEFRWATLQTNGLPQLIARMPNEPALNLLAVSTNGTQPVQESYPIPQGCEWSLSGDFLGTGIDQLIFSDADQEFLGIAQFQQGRIQFPRELPSSYEWVTATTVAQHEGPDLLLGITKQKKVYHARLFDIVATAGGSFDLNEKAALPLEEVTRDPYVPVAVNADSEGTDEFLVCTAYDAPFFLKWDGTDLTLLNTSAGFSTGLLKKSRPDDFLQLPSHPAFPSHWIRIKEATGQFLQLAEDGTITVLDQISLQKPGNLSGLLPLSNEKIALLNGSRDELEIHVRDANGILKFEHAISLPQLECLRTELRDGPRGLEMWVQGPARISRIRPEPAAFQLTTETLFETELEGVNHLVADTGDFNGDGKRDILALDPAKTHVLEFLEQSEDGWNSAMHFEIFDTAQNYKGRRASNTQPREYEIRDVTGDGLDDIIFLLHDRILVYAQDPVPEG